MRKFVSRLFFFCASETFFPDARTVKYSPASSVTSGNTHLAGFFALLLNAYPASEMGEPVVL